MSMGRAPEASLPLAAHWYEQASEAGDAEASRCLGWLYETGQGVDQDGKKAAALYRRAMEAGSIRAMGNLAWCYSEGIGVEQDQVQATELYRRGAEAGQSPLYEQLWIPAPPRQGHWEG